MRAMVLAAGLGVRLRPLTERVPKPLVPVLNRPLVERPIAALREAGLREIALNLHHLPEALPAALGDGAALGVRLEYSREEVLLGTGGGIRRLRDFLGGGTFVVLNGDSILALDLAAAIAAHRASGALATMVLHPRGWERYGAVEHDGQGGLVAIPGGERPDAAALRAAGGARRAMFVGAHVVEPEVLDALPADRPCDILRDGYGPLLARGARLGAHVLREDAFFSDVGTPATYLAASVALLAGRGPLVDPTAEVAGAAIDASTTVGPRARVRRGVRLERCIVWPDTEVEEDRADAILAPGIVVIAGTGTG